MKTKKDFLIDVSKHTINIAEICYEELEAMKESFCKHELVKLHKIYRDSYFEYVIEPDSFKFMSLNVIYCLSAIRYYPNDNEWILILNEQEYCIDFIPNMELIKITLLIKNLLS